LVRVRALAIGSRSRASTGCVPFFARALRACARALPSIVLSHLDFRFVNTFRYRRYRRRYRYRRYRYRRYRYR
jgi:hypothetical protein